MPKQESQEPKISGSSFKSSIRWLWRFFCSVRLAVVLVLIIAGMSLLGALTPLNVFSSIYFTIPGTMLMLNVLICSLNRWKSIKLAIRGGEIVQPESFYKTGTELKGIDLPYSQVGSVTEKILLSRGYRVRKSTGDGVHIAADKNRYFRLGTYLSHFSLILFVVAFLFGSHFGFRDTSFSVTEGETRQVGHNTELSLKLVSFVYEQYDNGMPKDYRSQVVLYKNGQQVREALIRVNYPLYYEGIRFYQLFFGTTAKMKVRDEKGQIIFDDNVPLGVFPEDPRYYQGYFDLPDQGCTIRLIASSVAEDPMIPAGKVAVGIIQNNQQINLKLVQEDTPTIVNGLEFTFQEMLEYSGFQVSRDPTNTFIWIASTLFVVGICAVLYFPHRQVWALSRIEGEGSRLMIRSVGRAGSDDTSELNNLIKEIGTRLRPDKGKV